ncbi:MAG: hypothetical protein CSYNP_01489 [Syntrophus sp. SKADARSKE-3]|nr:hypothetical protein [Syntrophus sp. SKADARSKE-3]
MNETMTDVKQPKEMKDVFALLFQNKSATAKDKAGTTKTSLNSFQAALQESLKDNDKGDMKTTLQALFQKKVELTGAKKSALTAKVADKTGMAMTIDQQLAQQLALLMGDLADSGKVDKSEGLQKSDLIAALQKMMKGKDQAGKISVVLTVPEMKTIAVPSETKVKVEGIPGMPVLSATASAKDKNVLALLNQIAEGKGTDDTITLLMEALKEGTMVLKGSEKANDAALLKPATATASLDDMKAQIEAFVTKIIKTDKEDLTKETSASLAAQIMTAFANLEKTIAGNSAEGEKDQSSAEATKAVDLFKTKIADILVQNGFDGETAERISEQVKKIAVIKEIFLPDMNMASKPLFDKLVQDEKAVLTAEDTETKLQGSMRAAFVSKKNPVSEKLSVSEKTPIIVEPDSDVKEQLNIQSKGDGKVIKTESAVFASFLKLEGEQEREFLNETVNRLNVIGDESSRKAMSATAKKAFLADRPAGTETLSSFTAFQNVSANAEVSSSVQPVRAQDIIAQIADLKNTQPDPSGRVKIVLDPPNLGSVEMDIAVRGNRVSAVMTAESSQVRQILQSHAEEMKQALVDQGFRIDHIDVKQPEDKGNQQWAQGGREWSQQGGYQQRRERQPRQKFEMPENMIQFNAVA